MDEHIKIFALGGLDENGKNCYVVNINNDLYIFDAGIRYPEESLLGIDIILPGINYLFENKDRIKAFFITHAHDENMGAIPFLCEEIDAPVYATKLAIAMISKTAKKFNKNYRQIHFIEIERNQNITIDQRNVYAFAVTHGSGEAVGYALETLYGLVVYTGDYILDFSAAEPYKSDFNRISFLSSKPVLCLLSESYNSTHIGSVSPYHKIESKVAQVLENTTKGRVFISLYGQNFFGLEEIIAAAKKNKYKIMLYTEYSRQIIQILEEIYGKKIIPETMLTKNALEMNTLVLVMENGTNVFQSLIEIAENNQKENSLHITENDSIILASPPHTGTELMFAKILDKLYQTNAKIMNFNSKQVISMHAGSEDLKMMLSIFRPKYYMPVRGYYIKMIENAKLAQELGYNHTNILVYDNGMVANFENGNLIQTHENVECNEIMVDGIGIGDVGDIVINDRRKLGKDGVMVLGISFSMSTREIVAGPDVQMRGLIFLKNDQDLVAEIAKCFENTVYNVIKQPGMVDFAALRNLCKKNISQIVQTKLNKDPMILPVIISI